MSRQVFQGGVHGRRYHADPFCPNAPACDREFMTEEQALGRGLLPCGTCTAVRVRCTAHRCLHSVNGSCTKHQWPNPLSVQRLPIAGCILYRTAQVDFDF